MSMCWAESGEVNIGDKWVRQGVANRNMEVKHRKLGGRHEMSKAQRVGKWRRLRVE